MDKKLFITTPIYYVNDIPHIGHTCTTVVADILARYHKFLGEDVFFITGTDEHGAKVAEAAREEGLSPQEFTDKVSKTFSEIWPKLNINFDYFIRTTNPEHKKIVSELLQKIFENGDIYKAKYEGLYCVGCEKFITEGEVVNGCCPLHPNREVAKQSEENWFFKLSKYVPTLIKAIEDENHPLHYKISPASKKSEVLARLKAGVNDLSISRADVSWGIPVPWDSSQTVYVWVDALINYYSAIKINHKENFWPANLHLIGKEILWFHAVIWEALLIAADLQLPKEVFAHNFYTVDGQKMSKSLGNVISPQNLLERFGIDGTRYLIASSFPSFDDADVGLKKFEEKYNADLANGLGNLVARISALCEKSGFNFKSKKEFVFDPFFKKQIEAFRFNDALVFVWDYINDANRKINEIKLWEQKGETFKESLQSFIYRIQEIAYHLQPFIPETAEKILKQFEGPEIKPGAALFPRIENEK
ncbi:class I tRNA ligase family protein [Patescibacteria group bacterium]|nr:class I tRNA ligase family protein [Patescibacteria group bacterium]